MEIEFEVSQPGTQKEIGEGKPAIAYIRLVLRRQKYPGVRGILYCYTYAGG